MPKPGMTGITPRKEVAELLRTKAKQANMDINECLEATLTGPSPQYKFNNKYPLQKFQKST